MPFESAHRRRHSFSRAESGRRALRTARFHPPVNMKLINCDSSRHAQPILDIFNDAIVNSTALYDYKPRTLQMMAAWFENKARGNFPVIGLEDQSGQLMGFASYGTFRAWPAYKYTIEHSVYVDNRFRRMGIGRRLLEELIALAKKQNYHTLIGVIDTANAASIALHEQLGFKHAGTLPQTGYKFGAWRDIAFYQLILSTPANPVDD